VVVDASAVVALLISPGDIGEQIARRLAQARLHAPDHLPVEVTNVIRRQHNAALLTTTEARLAIEGYWTLAIQLWPFETLRDRAWAHGANLSSYDAAYVALAERLGVPLITGDVRIERAPGVECEIEVFTFPGTRR
jgi:predicted nucleic acid-binding protein